MDKKGISLIEALFSAVILGMVIAGVIALFVHNLHLTRAARCVTMATNIAQKRLERVKKLPVGSLSAAAEAGQYLDGDGYPTTQTNAQFKRLTAITQIYSNDLVEIKVEVNYKEGGKWSNSPAKLVVYVH